MQDHQTEFKPNGEPQFPSLDERCRKEFAYGGDKDLYINLRLRRSVSWLGRAECELYHSAPPDLDMAFTCYWFAFNALYAKDPYVRPRPSERDSFKAFFETVIGYDEECKRAILTEIRDELSEPIKVLLDNEYAFELFWRYHNGVSGNENWETEFEADKCKVKDALGKQDVYEILSVLFDHLYVVRNQIVHGNATWNGGRNIDQLRVGVNIMAFVIPQLITSIMNNPKMKLGRPYYSLPLDAAQHPHNTTPPNQ